ncbi:MAG TPA: hypothetical protein VMJ30_10895 [Gemmatimonadales bacterium]|nr:hypothetical protein [Gemmatimonadales bacterium]
MAASRPEFLAALLLGLAAPAVAQQRAVVSGRVLRLSGSDSVAVPSASVVLHRITRAVQGPIDSLKSDSRGGFRFRLPSDTSAVFLVSARFAGIEYFGPPLKSNPPQPDTGLAIVVSDTSSSAPVTIGSRHAVVSRLGQDGTRGVLEIVGIRNEGDRTRVSGDTSRAVWGIPLPTGTTTVRPGQGDFSAEAVVVRHDSILLFAPIAPGEKQVVYSYSIPASVRRLPIRFDQPVPEVNLLLEDEDATVSGGALARADTQVIEGRTFQRWSGNVPAAATVMIAFPGAGSPGWLLPSLVGFTTISLLVAAWRLLSRASPVRTSAPADLIGAIAALDARYLGREGEVAAEEWQKYQAERARLKEQAELARGITGS